MNNQTPQQGADKHAEALVEELFKHASPRPQPPPADAEFIRQTVYQEWRQVVSKRRTRRRVGWLAAAASLLLMVGAATLVLRPQFLFAPPMVLATVERVSGDVRLVVDGQQEAAPVVAGLELSQGHALITDGGALAALQPASGGSLRLAGETRLKLLGEGRAELTSGAVYFDSRVIDQPSGHLILVTPMGTVRDVGTQFATRLTADSLSVSVREGLVTVVRGDDEVLATVGERVTLGKIGAPVSRDAVSAQGDHWRWVERIAPPFKVGGKRLIDVLGWYARETGRELEFGSLDAQKIAGEAILHESEAVELEGVTSALDGLLASSDLELRLVGAKIHIMLRTR